MAVVRRAGYASLGHFTLSESAWWELHCRPARRALPGLSGKYRHHSEVLPVVQAELAEIGMYRRYSDDHGYVLYVMRMQGVPT